MKQQQQLINDIKNWDKSDINQLKNWLDELTEICLENSEELQDFVAIHDLPTEDLSNFNLTEMADYPVWSCDKNGDCLVGDRMDRIENYKEILDNTDIY